MDRKDELAKSIPDLVDVLAAKLKEVKVEDGVFDLDRATALESKLTGVLADVRYHQNALLPANRLPTEIMSTIMRFLVDISDSSSDVVATGSFCRRWREMTVTDKALWCNVYMQDAHSPSMFSAPLYLERSGQMGIKVQLRNVEQDKFDDLVLDAFELHSSRIEEFEMNFFKPSVAESILGQLKTPNLAAFRLENHCREFQNDNPVISSALGAFTAHLPQLKLLRLIDIPSFNSGPFLNLTNLHWQIASQGTTLAEVLDILDKCSSLEFLHLYCPPDGIDAGELPAERRCTLPKLRILSAKGFKPLTALQYLLFPSSTAINIEDYSSADSELHKWNTFLPLFPFSQQRIGGPVAGVTYGLDFNLSYSSPWLMQVDIGIFSSSSFVKMQKDVRPMHEYNSWLGGLLMAFSRSGQFTSVDELKIAVPQWHERAVAFQLSHTMERHWIAGLNSFPQLERLSLHGFVSPGLFPALHFTLPALTALDLEVDIWKEKPEWFVQQVLKLAEKRHETGGPIIGIRLAFLGNKPESLELDMDVLTASLQACGVQQMRVWGQSVLLDYGFEESDWAGTEILRRCEIERKEAQDQPEATSG